MSDTSDFKKKPPQAVFEPGTLENTRRNIGMINPEEAEKMVKVLGGEIFTEKSVPIDYSKLPKKTLARKSSSSSRNARPAGSPRPTGKTSADVTSSKTASQGGTAAAGTLSQKTKFVSDLPAISQKDNQLIDKLMMSEEYGIKKNYGLFNFVRAFIKDGTERVIPEFVEINLKSHVTHIQNFAALIKTFIQISPNTFKAKVQNETDLQYRFLRKVASWSMRDIKLAYIEFENSNRVVLVSDLIPLVKAIYKQLITIYYLGDANINEIIKDIYDELSKYPQADTEKLQMVSKEAMAEWMYLHKQCAAGLYPLLMRMCGTKFVHYPLFFKQELSAILNFVGLKKFDLVLPQKRKTKEELLAEKEKIEKEKKAAQESEDAVKEKSEMVKTGLRLLDQMFPQAGFLHLEEFPDMYPYFEPLYGFGESFLYLSPDNPLQITVVLLKILEDFFMACHNIRFNIEENLALEDKQDSIIDAINEWPVYREDLFNRKYAEELKNLVNQTYTQPNFPSTQIGKKIITSLYWQTKYAFLPNFTFEQLLLERPLNDSKYIPLAMRTSFLLNAFSELSRLANFATPPNGKINGVENPWEFYHFDIASPVSKRLDILLNAKHNVKNTNANLIKYITCTVAVLNWWINTKSSPALKADPRKIFRISEVDGQPVFSVPKMDNQDKLFAAAIKKAFQGARG